MRRPARRPRRAPGLHYDPGFVSAAERAEILRWLATIHPLWEERFSTRRPPPDGEAPRRLLRPVYWLGAWQFACLDYYRPPRGALHRCVRAEPFPPVLERIVRRAEETARRRFPGAFIPDAWRLNTCLINLYGTRLEGGRRIDTARVGEHKDFEPGPVASVSLGERALFQFVASRRRGTRDRVVLQQWLEDGSLQLFAGDAWKRNVFHRVQRVDRRGRVRFDLRVEGFETRRVNFTFRFVPEEHIVPFSGLPRGPRGDVEDYVRELAEHSPFFAGERTTSPRSTDTSPPARW